MLYSNYKNKILKLSAVRDFVLRHKVAFCALICAIIALFATFLGFKGKIIKELDQQEIVVYGDNYRSGGGALFAFMGYEYRKLGDDEWVRGERPTAPGEYEVRGYALKGYGGKNYTEISTFTIEKRDVEIGVKQSEITYGDQLQVECELVSGDYIVEEKIKWNKSDIVNLNLSASVILNSVEIRNEKGENVTNFYNITCLKETVSVNKRVISVKVDGAEKEYDGTYLSCSKYEITSGETLKGETLSLSFNDYIKDYGAVENKPEWRVYNSSGKDVSELYHVIFDCGYLNITKRKITVKTASASSIYDGKAFYSTDFTIISEKGLVAGDRAVAESCTYITFFGSCQNVLDVNIYNGYERVTENYEIEYVFGTLSIEKRNVLISSHNGTLDYNGQEQTYEHFFVSGGSLANGDQAYSYNPASLKNIGSTENFLEVRIYHLSGEESTQSYNISYTYGSLNIIKRDVTLKPKDVNKQYDAQPLESTEYEVVAGSLASGHRAEIVTNGSISVVGFEINYIIGYEIYDYDNNVVTDNYLVTTQSGKLTVNKRNISIRPKLAQKTYDGTPLFASDFEITTNIKLVEGHSFSKVNYLGSQTNAGTGESSILDWQIVDESGNDVSGFYNVYLMKGALTVLGKDLIIETGNASKIYDGTFLQSREFVVKEGLLDGDNCFVVDSSRVIDYVEGGYDNKQTIEVYNAFGEWVTNNYNIIYNYGTLTIDKKEVTVKPNDAEKVYDALPLYVSSYEINGLISGHEAVVTTDDFIVDVGIKFVSVNEIIVFDENQIDKTHNYYFNCSEGKLTITKRSIKLKPTDEKKVYDGLPLASVNAETTDDSKYDLCGGHTVKISSTKALVEIGEVYDNGIDKCVITDAEGVDVTANYDIETASGSLIVEIIKIFVRPLEIMVYYDGTAVETIYNEETWLWGGSLLEGHEIIVETQISQNGLPAIAKFVGDYDVVITNFAILVDGNNHATIDSRVTDGDTTIILTDHYEVTLLKSEIKILKKKVYISTESKSVVYDESISTSTPVLDVTQQKDVESDLETKEVLLKPIKDLIFKPIQRPILRPIEIIKPSGDVLISAGKESVKVDFRSDSWIETCYIPDFLNEITLGEYQSGVTQKSNWFDPSGIIFYGIGENGEQIDTTKNYEIKATFGTLTIKKN